MTEPCRCEGVELVTPLEISNAPGLDRLSYRVGTHAGFLETMQARLASATLGGDDSSALQRLTSRQPGDPALALLDASAAVADVLSFYQERIANEGFLRTATERFSVMELGRLVGYAPKPGVAASVFLAFTLDPDAEAIIPAGHRSQSLPGPGETPQSFETSEALSARFEWGQIKPRTTQPQNITRKCVSDAGKPVPIFLRGAALHLQVNDRLLFDFHDGFDPVVGYLESVEPDKANDRTKVVFRHLEQKIAARSAQNLPAALGTYCLRGRRP